MLDERCGRREYGITEGIGIIEGLPNKLRGLE